MSNDIYVCPQCNSWSQVQQVEDAVVCHRCSFAWSLLNSKKLGWVCPKHNISLQAWLEEDKIVLYCPTCHKTYCVPESIESKVKRAYMVSEELI